MKINQQHQLVLRLRDEDLMTFGWIGKQLGCTSANARIIYLRAVAIKQSQDIEGTIRELDARAYNALRGVGLSDVSTRADVMLVIDRLRKGTTSVAPIKNFGKKSLRQIEKWLNRGEP